MTSWRSAVRVSYIPFFDTCLKIHSSTPISHVAFLLSVSACEEFKGAQIVKTWGLFPYFFADVILGIPWDIAFLPLLEKKLQGFLDSAIAIEEMEIGTLSAAQLLLHKKQHVLKEALPSSQNALIEMIRWKDWAYPKELLCDEDPKVEGEFSLPFGNIVGVSQSGDSIIRLIGICGKVSKKHPLPSYFTEEIGPLLEKKDILSSRGAGLSYLPRGEGAKRRLETIWRSVLEKHHFSFVSMPEGLSKEESCKELLSLSRSKLSKISYLIHEEPSIDYGSLTPKEGLEDLFSILVSQECVIDTLISSLQMIQEIPKIFSFEARIVLLASQNSPTLSYCKKALAKKEYYIRGGKESRVAIGLEWIDVFGRSWLGPKIELRSGPSKGFFWVVGSLLGPWERFLTLSLQKKGDLPCRLMEKCVRIFLLHPMALDFAKMVQERLSEAFISCVLDVALDASLKTRVQQGIEKGFVYLIVLGLEEVESNTLAWRHWNCEDKMRSTVDEFVNMVTL